MAIFFSYRPARLAQNAAGIPSKLAMQVRLEHLLGEYAPDAANIDITPNPLGAAQLEQARVAPR
jgi:hypothetical protein